MLQVRVLMRPGDEEGARRDHLFAEGLGKSLECIDAACLG